MAGLTVILSLIIFYVPLMYMLIFLVPLPSLVLAYRWGYLTAVLSATVAGVLVFVLLGLMNAAATVLFIMVLTLTSGWCYHKRIKSTTNIFFAYMGFFLVMIMMVLLFQQVTGQNFMEMLTSTFQEGQEFAMTFYEESGMIPQEQLAEINTMLTQYIELTLMLLPSAIILTPLVFAAGLIGSTNFILKRLKEPVDTLPRLKDWQLPGHMRLIIGVIIGLVVIPELLGFVMLDDIYIMTFEVVLFILFYLLGLSLIFYWLDEKNYNHILLKIAIIMITVVFSLLAIGVFLLGILDTYFNLRRFMKKRN
jgi:uncharacterized protein YybS (DUF2232 family)